jgi:hypothetical protein
LPFAGVEIVIDSASTVPFAVLLPSALAQVPLTSAAWVAVDVAVYVVVGVVVTVTFFAPMSEVTVNEEPETDATVPNVPPNP